MKKLFTLLTAGILTASVWAQSPQKMSYQAVIRNSSNQLITNQAIGMKISILQGSISGASVYTEIQTPTTNTNGLVTIEIGGGAGFYAINWANGPYFIKTETDPTGGSNYTIIGTSQLLSIPYALYAKTAETLSGGITETDPVFTGSPAHVIYSSDIANWNTAYGWGNHANAGYLKNFAETDPIYGTSAAKGITSTNITNWNSAYGWGNHANAGYLKAFTETDPLWIAASGNYYTKTNMQTSGAAQLHFNNLTNKPTTLAGYGITDADGSITNELQTLSLAGNDLTLSRGGGTVTLPTYSSDNWGTQTAKADATLSGNGTTSTPLKIAQQGATSGQVLKWSGSSWTPGTDNTGEGLTLPYDGKYINNDFDYAFSINSTKTSAIHGRTTAPDATVTIGVWGDALQETGEHYGVVGESHSSSGTGVFGRNATPTGATFGVMGHTLSPSGTGVYGASYATSGVNHGVWGQTWSTTGYGVYGLANNSTGINYGVVGRTESNRGCGIYGYTTSTDGNVTGVYGETSSSGGVGVKGYNSALKGTGMGIGGFSSSSEGSAIYGHASSTVGSNFGVTGVSSSISGTGVYGWALQTTGTTYGVKGYVNSPNGFSGHFTGGTFYVEGDVKIGVSGVSFNEIIQLTGKTPNHDWLVIPFPKGYTMDNTRVLSVEININNYWCGLGTYWTVQHHSMHYEVGSDGIHILYDYIYDTRYDNRPFRILIMRITK